MEFIHFGTDVLNMMRFQDVVSCSLVNKPAGCFWALPSTTEAKELASDMSIDTEKSVVFSVDMDDSILVVETADDLHNLTRLFSWAVLSTVYRGIFVTEEAACEVSGWDHASLVLFDMSAIKG